MSDDYRLQPVGFVQSPLQDRKNAPRQGSEGAPDACVTITQEFEPCLTELKPGQEIWLLTWLHHGARGVMQVFPRGNTAGPIHGVFATRSPDRPNPIGLHRAKLHRIDGLRIWVGPLEAIDGTPVVDIKPVLPGEGIA